MRSFEQENGLQGKWLSSHYADFKLDMRWAQRVSGLGTNYCEAVISRLQPCRLSKETERVKRYLKCEDFCIRIS